MTRMLLYSTFTMTLLGLLAAPAAFAETYTWRTDDGGYAYTDDRDQIPARYADRVKVVRSGSLTSYERYTPQDDAASDAYAARLAERLQYLRAVNGDAAPSRSAARQAPAAAPLGNTIALSTGDPRAPEIQVPVGGNAGPIIVEPVNAKRTGDFRTRRVTVVRQGGETIAVIKGNPHHFNPSNDIHDEDELEAGAPLR